MISEIKTLPLGSIAQFKSGGTPSKAKPHFWGGDFPWISAKDLKSPIIMDSIDRLTPEGVADANIAPKDSILILVRGMTLYKDVPVCLAGKDVAFNQDHGCPVKVC
jgi:type I restriction enzyme S subunit